MVDTELSQLGADRAALTELRGLGNQADGEAGIYGNSDAQGFLDKINPGNSMAANVVFDVPKGTKLKSITLDAG
ncbi:DUF4352 domain-containing protein [Micromonospora sonchi]|uniref:DUF4352 domain-containing protein n=1 Tax=Micromonospora sonchi TaxID=1763543 RepID=UPI0027E59CA1|nr:DUF4352 domain-containing protein [Micromonospora sonchi]